MSNLETQLERLVTRYGELQGRSKYPDLSDLPEHEVAQLLSLCRATVRRLAPHGSAYIDDIETAVGARGFYTRASKAIGVVEALLEDYRGGYLSTLEELIHGAMFADYLEMAEHLLAAGYKDAAAVIAGSTLEAHLRQLCARSGLEVTLTGRGGTARPKKASAMNDELAKTGAYSKLDQKSVTSWLGIRNDAAHGNYGNYTKQQVALLVPSIRDFLVRNPA